MSNKILKYYTIIPPHLYVRRQADRMMEFIINDTGRPGYVLVARQMGKTNLLLNAKESLISSDDACVYIDFSNSFRTARECFRHIIDLIIKTNTEKLFFLEEALKKSRNSYDEVDHVEHESELVLVLNVLKGKLIIFIDEVDAMTTVSFSDTIFKQIRSVYFSRTNFPILHKLNYVLSGVGEPSSLIKDPKISPFNIGQEILLGDFSYDEYLTFIEKSKLPISQDVISRIYYWASGNPRMTYEICSAIEDITIQGYHLDMDTVDETVEKMYLTTYDRVPLDNIRSLIMSDYEIHGSVKSIKEGDFNVVSSAQRRKLYLAGIIGPGFEKDIVTLKNRIIDKALSIEWLSEVGPDQDDIIEIASLAASTGNYDEVINVIERNIDKYSGDSDFAFFQQLVINAYYKQDKFDNIIEHFLKRGMGIKISFQHKVKVLKSESLYLYALSLINKNRQTDALEVIQSVISLNAKSAVYFNALFTLAHISLGLDEEVNGIPSKLSIYTQALNELTGEPVNATKEELQLLKCIAYFNLGRLTLDLGKRQEAFDNFSQVAEYAPDSHRASAVYYMAVSTEDTVKQSLLFEEAIDIIIQTKAKPRNYYKTSPLSINYANIFDLIEATVKTNRSSAFKLTKYLYEEEMRLPQLNIDDSMLKNIEFRNSFEDESLARDKTFLITLNEFAEQLSQEQLNYGYNIFKASNKINIKEGYGIIKSIVKLNFLSALDPIDVSYLAIATQSAISKGDTDFSASIIKYLRDNYFNKGAKSLSENILVEYYEMELMSSLSNTHNVFDKAKSILGALKNFNTEKIDSPFLTKGIIDVIRNAAFKNYSELLSLYNDDESKKLANRNRQVTVLYSNGKAETGKFKRFEKDIQKHRCRIINN